MSIESKPNPPHQKRAPGQVQDDTNYLGVDPVDFFNKAFRAVRTWVNGNNDNVVTSQELLTAIEPSIEEYLRSDQGQKLSDADRRQLAEDTLLKAGPAFSDLFAGTGVTVQDITPDQAHEAATKIILEVNSHRSRTA